MSVRSVNNGRRKPCCSSPAEDRASPVAPPAARPLRPVLIILHQETSSPGRVGNALRALGHPLDIRRPRFGDALPETLDGHAGAVIFGGPMSANDPDDYVRREIDWIAVPLREQRPFLGICLGAQMLARHLGARVAPHPRRPRADRLLPDPPDARRAGCLPALAGPCLPLAPRGIRAACGRRIAGGGSDFPVEAFQFDHAFGFQFHPDVTYAMMHRWTTRGHARTRIAGRAGTSPSLRRSRGA